MKLRSRFLLINAAVLFLAFILSMAAFLYLAEAIVKKWSLNIAENQMLYDKTRTL